MKKAILILLLAISTAAYSQKKDTVVTVTMSYAEFNALLKTIDANIDSKSASQAIRDFLIKNAKIVADKPKEQIEKKP